MSDSKEPILLIDAGDLPSLVSAVLQPDPSRLVLWQHAWPGDETALPRHEAVAANARRLGVQDVMTSDGWTLPSGTDPVMAGHDQDEVALRQTLELVHAAVVARRIGANRIIWPVQAGGDPAGVTTAVDRASAVTELMDLTGSTGKWVSLFFDLPLVDLVDEQVVDLADDCGALAGSFWPCLAAGRRPCLDPDDDAGGTPDPACPECRRWQAAFRENGLPWPWRPRTATVGA